MPDLFGICSSDLLTPPHRAAIESLRDGFALRKPFRLEETVLPHATVGICSWHGGDCALLRKEDGAGESLAWIAAGRRECVEQNLQRLVPEFRKGSFAALPDLAPPFAGCFVTAEPRSLCLVTDPFGLMPTYYAVTPDALVFATKVSPILRTRLVEWRLDRPAVIDLFTYEHLTQDRTLVEQVRVVPPGTVLCYRNGKVVLETYSRPLDRLLDPRYKGSLDQAGSRLHEYLVASVAEAVHSAPRVAVTLSGGLDSRALLGCAARSHCPVRAYTFGDERCADVHVAKKVAKAAGVPHQTVAISGDYLRRWREHITFVTDGMVSCIHAHILSLAEVLKTEADVVLDGLGGDALTGGHLKWRMVTPRGTDSAASILYRARATAFSSRADRQQLFTKDFLTGLDYDPKDAVGHVFAGLRPTKQWIGYQRFDILERQRRFIQFGPQLLRPFVQVETPFYDPSVTMHLLSMPLGYLLEQRAYLHMHTCSLSRLARLPDTLRGVPLTWPLSLRFAKKVLDFTARRAPSPVRPVRRALSPTNYAQWLRHDLRDLLCDTLLSDWVWSDGIIDRDTVQRLVGEHLSGAADQTAKLGCLLTFAAWRTDVGASLVALR